MANSGAVTRIATGATWRYAWWGISALICMALLLATYYRSRAPFLDYFNLRDERNAAALWSGTLLLLCGLHALDGWLLEHKRNLQRAYGWVALGAVLFALSFDEIGSLHERVPEIGPFNYWMALLPFALVLGSGVAYALIHLPRKLATWIFVAFALFASVALQEFIEHSVEWSGRALRLRAVVEEGTELLAFLILLAVCMTNTRGRFADSRDASAPTLAATQAHAKLVLVLGLVGAPLVAGFTAALGEDEFGHGRPADWPSMALFVMAGLCAVRPFLAGVRRLGPVDLGLLVVCIAGCFATTLDATSSSFGAALLTQYTALGIYYAIANRATWMVGGEGFEPPTNAV